MFFGYDGFKIANDVLLGTIMGQDIPKSGSQQSVLVIFPNIVGASLWKPTSCVKPATRRSLQRVDCRRGQSARADRRALTSRPDVSRPQEAWGKNRWANIAYICPFALEK